MPHADEFSQLPEIDGGLDDTGMPMLMEVDGGEMNDLGLFDDMFEDQFDFFENIAERIDVDTLKQFGSKWLGHIDDDIESRKPWEEAAERGIQALGLLTSASADQEGGTDEDDDVNAVKQWQSKVIHTALSEAIIRFAASASKELAPPEGPAKGRVISDYPDEDLRAQADRVAKMLNYVYTDDDIMPDADDDFQRALIAMAREGSVFREPFWDPVTDLPDIANVSAADLIMPITAESLYKSPRITHRLNWTRLRVMQMQDTGYFLPDVDIDSSTDDENEETERARNKIEGYDSSGSALSGSDSDADEITLYKHRCYAVMPDDIDGGELLPYLAWLTDSGEVLRICRDWDEEDGARKRLKRYIPYYFGPMDGCVYGIGLYHFVGYLAETATDCLRSLIDAGKLSNQKAFLVGSEVKLDDVKNKQSFGPGEWRQVPFAGVDFKNAVVQIEWGQPSPVLFQLMQEVVQQIQRLASTMDMQVGDANNAGPVGTTLALIEQGSVVYHWVHARLHRSRRREFNAMVGLLYDHIPEGATYPYKASSDDRSFRILDDLDERVDVEPVSDPKLFSKQHRLALNQAILQLSESAPELYDRFVLHQRMNEALGATDHAEYLINPVNIVRMDALNEGLAMLHGKPVTAFPDQAHMAHIQIHKQWFESLPDEGKKALEPVFMAHMGEHYGWLYKQQVIQSVTQVGGVPPQNIAGLLQSPDMHGRKMEMPHEISPEAERALDQLVAVTVGMMGGGPKLPGENKQKEFEAEQQQDQVEFVADEKRKQESFDREEGRKDIEFANEMKRDALKALVPPAPTSVPN